MFFVHTAKEKEGKEQNARKFLDYMQQEKVITSDELGERFEKDFYQMWTNYHHENIMGKVGEEEEELSDEDVSSPNIIPALSRGRNSRARAVVPMSRDITKKTDLEKKLEAN